MIESSAELVDRARDRTGLSDVGPGDWRIGLDRLVEAVDSEVQDPDSLVRIEALIVERLVQRLRIEGWYAEHGAAAGAPVEAPVVVFGLPRTGTTALHHLLSVDPQFRYLRSWELNDPVPPPDAATEQDDPRRPTGPARVDPRHIVTVDGPAEDWPIHALAFDHAELTLPLPSYSTWWRTRDHDELCAYHERILRLLHSHRPPRRWLLKMPAYVFLIDEMAAHYPDATFVMTHRDPVAVIASTCSVVAESRRKRVPTWSPDADFGRAMLEHWVVGAERSMAARDRLADRCFVDVAQDELEADAAAVAERVYQEADLTMTGALFDAMTGWSDESRRSTRGAHRYRLEEYGLSEAEVRTAFGPYLERFGHLCPPARPT